MTENQQKDVLRETISKKSHKGKVIEKFQVFGLNYSQPVEQTAQAKIQETRDCNHWLDRGTCGYKNCRFVHNLASKGINNAPCHFWVNTGSCTRMQAGECEYSHNESDKGVPMTHKSVTTSNGSRAVCTNFLRGGCKVAHCKYRHPN